MKVISFKNAIWLYAYIFIIWGFYRFIFQLPEVIEESIIKPIVWLLPVFYLTFFKEKRDLLSIGITLKNIFPSIYYSLGLGAFFVFEALIVNYVKYGGNFSFGANIGNLPFTQALSLSFATAITEEIVFRGYIFNRLWEYLKNEVYTNLLTSILWALIHLPVTIFLWKLDFPAVITYLFLTTIFGIGSAFVFARTKNILSPILLHVLWQWPIILFR